MPGAIFTLVEHPESGEQTLAAARHLASLMGFNKIEVLAIQGPAEMAMMPAGNVAAPAQANDAGCTERDCIQKLHRQFDAWAAETKIPGLKVQWNEIKGLPDTLIGEWGRRSDFVVLNRQVRCNRVSDRLAMQAALFDTDRPVLIASPGKIANFGENVVIAWRNDKRTERAVLSALPLLKRANSVHIVAGRRSGAQPVQSPAFLAANGISAQMHILPVGMGNFGKTLLNAAHEIGADLLVMGAYTHNPWRELILGGVTSTMIAQSDLPILMRH